MKEGLTFTSATEPKQLSPEDIAEAADGLNASEHPEVESESMLDQAGMSALAERLGVSIPETAASAPEQHEAVAQGSETSENNVVRLDEVRERLKSHAAAPMAEAAPAVPEARLERTEAPKEQVDAFLRKAYGGDAYMTNSGLSSFASPAEKFAHIMKSRTSRERTGRNTVSWFSGIASLGAGLGGVGALGLMSVPAAALAPVLAAPAVGYGVYRLLKWNADRNRRKLENEARMLGISAAPTREAFAA